jgi:hypothetical protein
MTNHDTAADGLLDGEERQVHVELRGDGAGASYPRGTFRQIVTAMITLVMAIAATYAVPQLHWARPWTAEMDYVPFWNLIGRELLGEGETVAEANVELLKAQELAREEALKEAKAEPFVDKRGAPPVAGGRAAAGVRGPRGGRRRVEMPLENVGDAGPVLRGAGGERARATRGRSRG